MKILFVTSECAPYSKSGGLADVAFSLPPALAASGDKVAIITPLYQCVKAKYMDGLKKVSEQYIKFGEDNVYCGLFRGTLNGVTVWFIDNEDLFNRPNLYGYDDDKYRFAVFSRAVIELLDQLDFIPDILHCNDWESALSVIYLKNDQEWRQELQGIRSVYTIHNIAYQGQFGANELTDTFKLPGGWYAGGLGYEYEGRSDVNLMKGAMLMADAVSTVSPTYAKELHLKEFGHGLEHVADEVEYKMYGILNGIDMDHYDPMKDKRIPYAFSAEDMSGKAKCKAYIQKEFGLKQEPNWPLFCSVARLVEQKGIELIKQILPSLMEMGIQLIIFGQGEQRYIDYFNWAMEQWPGQLGFSSDYSEDMAAKVFAGSDMYLMPSRFEPCGLSQMMAMRYGTIPIVHETGGLKDSVRAYSDFDGVGDGFTFSNYTGKELYYAIHNATRVYFGDESVFAKLRKRCMVKDFSWDKSAQQYNRMYGEIVDKGADETISFEEAFEMLKKCYTKINQINQKKETNPVDKDYHLSVQIQITGRGAGVMYIEFNGDEIDVQPYVFDDADAKIAASLDNLLGMALGTVSADKLFMNGQLKVSGNISRGIELRRLFRREEN